MEAGKSTLKIHYRRTLTDYDGWELWLWGVRNGKSSDGFSLLPLIDAKTMAPYRDPFGTCSASCLRLLAKAPTDLPGLDAIGRICV
mmetsp:Transcript_14718/g.59827  ORF Transcript_14718/g.59827 Transcript_14718/m.59827 type:complete len:86 (+) Transcript_14718:354-611(+)